MKKIFITLSTIIILIIIVLIIAPTFFKDDILRLIENQSNKYIRPKLEIKDVSLSMFKNFPDLNVTLKDIRLSESTQEGKDTLVLIPCFEASINLKSLISGNEIIINNILLKDCRFQPQVNETGLANWDILLPADSTSNSSATDKPTPPTENDQSIKFNNIEIQNLHINYKDFQTSTFASIANTNMQLQGNLAENNTLIQVILELKNICFSQGNSIWINNTNFKWEADIEANLKEMLFNIKKNEMLLNDLKLDLTGNFGIKEDKYTMDLNLHAPDTKFKSLLAMIPKEFQKYIKGVKTDGEFQLNLTAKGEYYDNHLPALNMQFNITNANFKYPELPEAIKDINLKLNISNPGGSPNLTTINLSTLAFSIANNPFNMNLLIANPEDPTLKGTAKGVINFENLKKAIPLKDVTLEGILNLDFAFNGKYQYIEKEQYEKFIATGKASLKNILLKNTDFPKGISIPHGDLTVSPTQLKLNNLMIKINSSDLALDGYISNYLPYLFKEQTLKGNFKLKSNLINLNEFMSMVSTDTTLAQRPMPTDTTKTTILEVPKNIQIDLNTTIKKLIFDQLSIKDIHGIIQTTDGIATLKNLDMALLEGKMVMNGIYNTKIPTKPSVDFGLKINDIDITAAYNAFSFIKQNIPVAMNCSGKISTAMKFSSDLDQAMSPIMTTANGSGNISTTGFLIKDNPTLTKLSSLLKNEDLSRISISNLKMDFTIKNGNITIEPFTTKVAGKTTTIYGTQSVDGNIDYTLSMNIKKESFGKDINNLLSSLPGANNIKALDIDVKIEGSLAKPSIKPDLSKAIKAVEKEAGKEIKNNILKGIDKLFKKK